MKKAIILCSGGLDSVVTAMYAKMKEGYQKITILFFNYNQKSLSEERKCSKECAKMLGAEFVEINLKWLGEISNSLINKKGIIKKLRRKNLKDTSKESEKFYVPCRNTIFLSYALALAESFYFKNKEVNDILVGFKCEGKESYPDTTKEFISEMNKLARNSCSIQLKIIAPLIKKDKEDIVLIGEKLGIDWKKTFSCYAPLKGKHCGYCLACKFRQEGFYWANIKDPTIYKEKTS